MSNDDVTIKIFVSELIGKMFCVKSGTKVKISSTQGTQQHTQKRTTTVRVRAVEVGADGVFVSWLSGGKKRTVKLY